MPAVTATGASPPGGLPAHRLRRRRRVAALDLQRVIGSADGDNSGDDRPATAAAPKDIPLGKRILLVEDEFFVALEIAQILQDLGYSTVATVPDLDGALRAIAQGGFDAAVLDINLRGQLVYPAADALRDRGIPFIFATGYGAANIPLHYRDLPRLQKPFDAGTLADAMRKILPVRH